MKSWKSKHLLYFLLLFGVVNGWTSLLQLYHLLSHTTQLQYLTSWLTMSLTLKHANNPQLNFSLTLCKVTGFAMEVLNGCSLQSEWERVVNGLHKEALFIHAPTQPAPVTVRRRDIATGVVYMCVWVWEVGMPVVCVCVYVCMFGREGEGARAWRDTQVVDRSKQGAFTGCTQR